MMMMMAMMRDMQESMREEREAARFERQEREEAARLRREEEDYWRRERSQTRDSHVAPAAPARFAEPAVKEPDPFDGKRSSKLSHFLTQSQMVFALNPSRFANDNVKILYMVALLRGHAMDTVRPLLQIKPEPEVMLNLRSFIEYLSNAFGDPDETGTALSRLRDLKQTGSAAEYFARFRELIGIVGWHEPGPILFQAQEGLSSHLRDEIARQAGEFDTLEELIGFVVPLDNRLRRRDAERGREVERERRSHRTAKSDGPVASGPSLSHPRPPFRAPAEMRSAPIPPASAVRPSEPYLGEKPRERTPQPGPSSRPGAGYVATSGARPAPRGPPSPEEKERRYREGLCAYCGGRGHMVKECDLARRRGERDRPRGNRANVAESVDSGSDSGRDRSPKV